ncbi:hypothetical protein J6590_051021 [Homalodisca vitripennis]|nr:hypothetical protein J6590_051021 [Homalodisca vitripennis]
MVECKQVILEQLALSCSECEIRVGERNSQLKKSKSLADEDGKAYDINISFVYALQSIGVRQETGQVFAGSRRKRQLKRQSQKIMEIETLHVSFMGAGFSSLSGVVSATSVITGQVIYAEVMSKFFQCKERLDKDHEHKCIANNSGTSDDMEVKRVTKMFECYVQKQITE